MPVTAVRDLAPSRRELAHARGATRQPRRVANAIGPRAAGAPWHGR